MHLDYDFSSTEPRVDIRRHRGEPTSPAKVSVTVPAARSTPEKTMRLVKWLSSVIFNKAPPVGVPARVATATTMYTEPDRDNEATRIMTKADMGAYLTVPRRLLVVL